METMVGCGPFTAEDCGGLIGDQTTLVILFKS
jgi:hypothetical protein